MKRIVLSILPFIISLFVGISLYFIPIKNGDLKNLFLNLSSTFIGITLTYLCYTSIKNFLERKLRKTLIEYAKVKIDEEILSCINQLQKMIYPLDEIDKSFDGITKFINISKDELKKLITQNEVLGFQIFKEWDILLGNIEKILENNYVLKYLTDNQIIIIVELLREINFINNIKEVEGLFMSTNKKNTNFKIIPPDITQKYPNRFLLLKKIEGCNDKGIVVDFGEIPKYNVNNSLIVYKINNVGFFTTTVYDFFSIVKNWINSSGKEILLFSKNYRVVKNKTKNL